MKKAKNLNKQAIGSVGDLVIIFWNRKKKANTDDKCYNYLKLDYFGQDYLLSNDKKLNKTQNLYSGRSKSYLQSSYQITNNQNNNSRV